MDLGKTIVTNDNFSFDRALISIYNKYSSKNISLEEFLKVATEKKKIYNLRDITNIEVSFKDYITSLESIVSFNYPNFDELEDYFLENCMDDMLIDNVVSFIEYVRCKNIEIVIVSNSTFSSRALKKELENFHILHYFKDLISSSDYTDNITYRKPHHLFFEKGIQILNIPKETILFIGNDYHFDIEGAINCGLKTAWFTKEVTNNKNIITFNNYSKLKNQLDI